MGKKKKSVTLAVNKIAKSKNKAPVVQTPTNTVKTPVAGFKRQRKSQKITATAKKLKFTDPDCEITSDTNIMANCNASISAAVSETITIAVLANLLSENAKSITGTIEQRLNLFAENIQNQNEKIEPIRSRNVEIFSSKSYRRK